MAKKMYIGIGGAARRIKKAYIGIGGTARRIKKAYIGVGGVARPCFTTELEYWGQAPDIYPNRYNYASASNDNYGIFASGQTASGNSSYVSAYSKTLTQSNPSAIGAYLKLAAVSSPTYAIFAGGHSGTAPTASTVRSELWTYNTSLTIRTVSSALSEKRCEASGVFVNGSTFFAGGRKSSGTALKTVDMLNSSMTRTVVSELSKIRVAMGAACVGNYAVFIGGGNGTGSYTDNYSDIDVFNASGTIISSAVSLATAKKGFAVAELNDCAIIAGGYYDSGASEYRVNNAEVLDSSLTLTSITELSSARHYISSATVGEYAIFSGGVGSDAVDVYDASYTRSNKYKSSKSGQHHGSLSVGSYALFAGHGSTADEMDYKVDVYTV